MQLKNNRGGFTIIELIVVIAIIAVLASIVLVSVTQYIASSKYAAAKAQLGQLQVAAGDYFSTTGNGSYSGFCSSDASLKIQQAIESSNLGYNYLCIDSGGSVGGAGGYTLCSTSNKWIAYAVDAINGPTKYWCVDYSGNRKAAYQGVDCSCN